jgi:hypothetical protein
MIKRIEVAGLRGKSLDLELEPLTLVLGQNTSGKTTIADAIRWAILGYIPTMDAPPRGWAALLAPGTGVAGVVAHLDKGQVAKIACGLRLEKGGSAKASREENGIQLGALDPGKTKANLLTLDPTRFLKATGPDRAAMLASATNSAFDWKALVPEKFHPEKSTEKTWSPFVEQLLNTAKWRRQEMAAKKKTLIATLRGLEGIRQIVVGDDAALAKELDKDKERVGELREQLRAVTKQIAKVKDAPLSSARQRLDMVRRSLEEYLGTEYDAGSYSDRYNDVLARQKELAAIEADQWTRDEVEAMAEESQKLELNLGGLKATVAIRQENLRAIKVRYAGLKKKKCCPTCGNKGPQFIEAIKLAEQTETKRERESLDACAGLRDAEIKSREELTQRRDEAGKYWREVDLVAAQLAELRREGELIKLWQEHDALVAEIETQAAEYDVQGLEERAYEFECEISDLQERIYGLAREQTENTYKRSQIKQLTEIELQLHEAEQGWIDANGDVNELEQLRKMLTAVSMGPIFRTLGTFTKDIFVGPLSLDGTELGRMVGSRWVVLDQFSGAEQAVAIAALTCALAGEGKQNLVLADELSAFDDEHLVQFLANVSEAIEAGFIDQFIGFSTPRKNIKTIPKTVTIRTI